MVSVLLPFVDPSGPVLVLTSLGPGSTYSIAGSWYCTSIPG